MRKVHFRAKSECELVLERNSLADFDQPSTVCVTSSKRIAFRIRMIALELVFNSEDCFYDLSCLIFDFYWFCSIIASDIVVLLRSNSFPSLAYTLVLVLPRQ